MHPCRTKTILTELLPYVLLVFFNASIYRAIRRSLELQKSMRCTSSQQEEIKSANVVVSTYGEEGVLSCPTYLLG